VPLVKRSPIKRGKARSWNSTLRVRSRKREAIYVERRAFVREYVTAHPTCELLPCGALSVDVHEVIRRSHGAALYPGQPGKRETPYMALCRAHHDYITTHPAWARERGYEVR
jgi:hypothetical protein